MNIAESLKTCLITKYANFYDRAPRSEFWWFQLSAVVIIQVYFWFIEIWLEPTSIYWTILGAPVSVGLSVSVIAVTARDAQGTHTGHPSRDAHGSHGTPTQNFPMRLPSLQLRMAPTGWLPRDTHLPGHEFQIEHKLG